MKRIILLSIAVILPVLATQRVMVLEKFTATWCQYCPGAARGAEELKFRAFDSVVVISYHSSNSDPFYTAVAANRASYYSISGYPTTRIDGGYSIVGGMRYGTMYPVYRGYFDQRKTEPSPLDIRLAVSYDSVSRNGTLTIVVENTSSGVITGRLHTVLIESHIYYPWQGMDSLHDVVRTMLPNASGEEITVNPGDSVDRTRNFTVASNWVAENCELVVFVQTDATRWIHQGARIGVISRPELEFVRFQPSVVPAPGATVDLNITLRNIGSASAGGASATLTTTDPYVTVTNGNTTFGPIPVGEDVTTSSPVTIQVSSGCPDPHLAQMQLVITTSDFSVDTVVFPLNIASQPGFADDMESGEGDWTHGGIRDYWHLSTYRSNSPSTSWYCGNEAGHQYINEMDARLYSPFFTIGHPARVSFYHYYATAATYDQCVVEINNGSPFWYPVASFAGSNGNWELVELDLSEFLNQTVRLRFRLISDYSGVAEGWYIDDFLAGAVGISEKQVTAKSRRSLPTIVNRERLMTVDPANPVTLFDASGRRILTLKSGSNDLSALAPGLYFIRTAEGDLHRAIFVR